jgi:hypothetical protein
VRVHLPKRHTGLYGDASHVFVHRKNAVHTAQVQHHGTIDRRHART